MKTIDFIKESQEPKKSRPIKSQRIPDDHELQWMQANNVKEVSSWNNCKLSRLKKDAPSMIYLSGSSDIEKTSVGIVGTRKADMYGIEIAYELAKELSGAGINIVSGGAEGVDTAALKGAVDSNHRAVVVLGGGHAKPFPGNNTELFKQIILHGGTLISEYPPYTRPLPQYFLWRNRIIAALSDLVVIVEAPIKSGAISTAWWAKKLDIPIFTLPADIWYEKSAGNNILLKNGAKPLTDASDIINYLNIKSIGCFWKNRTGGSRPFIVPPEWKSNKINFLKEHKHSYKIIEKSIPDHNKPVILSNEERKILDIFKQSPLHFDELIIHSGMKISFLSCNLMKLELAGLIKSLPGGFYIKP